MLHKCNTNTIYIMWKLIFSIFHLLFTGTFVLLWRRGTNVLTASQLMVTRDERIRLMNGYNLEITELEPQDAGDYVCQISDKVNKDQVHTVEILGKHFHYVIFKIFAIVCHKTFNLIVNESEHANRIVNCF